MVHHLSEELLTERIQRAGLRLTLPRRAICRVLANSDEAFLSASMIAEQVWRTAGQVDASTVYRTLDELARIGLVHLIHLGSGQPSMWHLTLDHSHEHLVCEGCGTTIEVPKSGLLSLVRPAPQQVRIPPQSSSFHISRILPRLCRSGGSSPSGDVRRNSGRHLAWRSGHSGSPSSRF